MMFRKCRFFRLSTLNTILCQQAREPDEERKERIVIIGGGVMGGSAAWLLSKQKNMEVTVFEAGEPGSSWGETRISRLAYRDPMKIRLMQRSYELWDELKLQLGKDADLLRTCPIIDMGEEHQLQTLQQAYKTCNLPYEILSAKQLNQRCPGIVIHDPLMAVWQEKAAIVLAANCVQGLFEASEQNGVTWKGGEKIVKVDRKNKVVINEDGESTPYDKLVICAGPWTNYILNQSDLPLLPLVVSNEQSVYYDAKQGQIKNSGYTTDDNMPITRHVFPERQIEKGMPKTGKAQTIYSMSDYDTDGKRMPIIIYLLDGLGQIGTKVGGIYAIPHITGGHQGLKIGYHCNGDLLCNDEFLVPDISKRELAILPHDRKQLRKVRSDNIDITLANLTDEFVKNHFPGLEPKIVAHMRCMYTNTTLPDLNPMIGVCPQDPHVFICCGFSGEGFKFGPVFGEMITNFVCGNKQVVPEAVEAFRLDRLPWVSNDGTPAFLIALRKRFDGMFSKSTT